MKVMTLNCGSSSVKYSLVEMPAKIKICHGIVERVTLDGSFIKHFKLGDDEFVYYHEFPTYLSAISFIIELLTSPKKGVIRDLAEIDAIGHRVVHGGEEITKSIMIDDGVIKKIEECSPLAPLHNPANLSGIRAVMSFMEDIPNIAVFDTAFFATIPPHIYTYALPFEWYEESRIRKYGFHGTSHRYVSVRTAELLDKGLDKLKIIVLHIGNGVSVTAVKGGNAYDHSMGFTPLEGAVMGTRCGDIDPAIPLFVMKKEKLESRDMEDILNKKSGLLGITGKYSDRRQIIQAMKAGDERAKLAFEVECYRLKKYIGAYAAGMGGLDGIAFTAGVGENSSLHRFKICDGLEFLGVRIDPRKNERAVGGDKEVEISAPDSHVKVFVIPTDEEMLLGEEVFRLLKPDRLSAERNPYN